MIAGTTSRVLFTRLQRFSFIRSQIVSYAKSAKEEQQLFWKKNAALRRPQSPHLTIYRLPLPPILSIIHRVSGAVMATIINTFGCCLLYFAGNSEQGFALIRDYIHPYLLLAFKLALSFGICYHGLNGIRHLVWDTGRMLGLPIIYKTGYLVVATAIVSAFALALQ